MKYQTFVESILNYLSLRSFCVSDLDTVLTLMAIDVAPTHASVDFRAAMQDRIKRDCFKDLRLCCQENFFLITQEGESKFNPILKFTHDELWKRSRTEMIIGLSAYEAVKQRIFETHMPAQQKRSLLPLGSPQPTTGRIEFKIYQISYTARKLPQIFYEPSSLPTSHWEHIPLWEEVTQN